MIAARSASGSYQIANLYEDNFYCFRCWAMELQPQQFPRGYQEVEDLTAHERLIEFTLVDERRPHRNPLPQGKPRDLLRHLRRNALADHAFSLDLDDVCNRLRLNE